MMGVAVRSCRLTRPMQTVYPRLPVDITFGGAVAGFAANVRKMEHHLKTFPALVREWGLGGTTRIFF